MFKKRIVTAACAFLLFGPGAYAVDENDPENSARNKRDRDPDTVSVFDQGSSEADRNITAEIRQAVVDDDSLSMNAHNVKIITKDGKVTLRGPVDSAAEKVAVESAAKKVAGVKDVQSQLEVDRD